ncbi:uncharacterized protein LOC136041086 [Artemia franciscana]|uniref:uncharacterized protein LOC136041086 n=1 Tax=Artemia franciscana TaxID=6661 RepID=UPI0032DB2510
MKIQPNSASYPSELPVKLVREYAPFIAWPLSLLINLCFMLGTFQDIWKKAYIRVIPKSSPPKACDELRPISISPCVAKVTEAFVLRRLLDQISSSIDKYQYGGLQECSTTVYLVRMYDCILTWLDKGNRFLDLGAIDSQKAFDFINHLIAGKNLKIMGAKKRVLSVIMDFLSNRKQRVYALFEGGF